MDEPNNRKEYLISDLVQEFNISQRTIRYYEELGLISPRRTAGSHRIYSRRDRARIKMILRGKMLGFSLKEIASLLQLYEIDPTQKRQYEEGIRYAYLEEVRNRIEELKILEQELVDAIEEAKRQYRLLKKKEEKT
ncbi:MerR family transcriptional regulator [Polycladomyces subterraneus]|uniref:MerR family transcriptional regulator n=1 Tax=Polycladomyces subterraneus TaxID=1016997 RepID=A0ABT8IQZ3_9BACL|nr:MerR family transcriptional regulator [Polycladomyces subterraneus]MDN4595220.1 MerR family transcriptional regulator [Polycladomyces subterraneus]